MEQESYSGKKFVPAFLPWLVGIGALIFYLVTLNHWVSVYNWLHVARINGWSWQPNMSDPLFVLATYPLHLLPAKLVPLALNVFTAVCAGLTLTLLARSVALLPHDRTDIQRQRLQGSSTLLSIPLAWIPVVFAVLVCGLQRTFWEHATNASGHIFKLLIFAYIIRCLLEFRIDKRQTWLSRSALLYGAGMANSWAMIGFFPAFIAALIWIKGLEFFNLRFLSRMLLLGLAGLSVYLLLPVAQNFSSVVPIPFWQGLKGTLVMQKNMLSSFPKQVFLLLGLTSLLPIFVISIRWASYFGDPSPLGTSLTTLIFHVVHGLFLLACIWVAFDPPFSPRPVDLAYQRIGWDIPFLTFYYLGALSIGYLSGYFLLVFGNRSKIRNGRYLPAWVIKTVNVSLIGAVALLFILSPSGLIYKNLPEIRRTNGSGIVHYATWLTESLPDHAVVFSDDPLRLMLAESALNRSGGKKDHVLLDTQSLKYPWYHKFLHQRYGDNWPETIDPKRDIFYSDVELVNVTMSLSKKRPVYYLHPSFGYYFEYFYGRPHGLALEMNPYPSGMISPPPLTETEIAENQSFWNKAETEDFQWLAQIINPPDPKTNSTFRQLFMDKLYLKPEISVTAGLLGLYYSHSLNYWGVEMQKAGQLDQANQYFSTALEMNPMNIVATINQKFNQTLRNGERTPVTFNKSIEDKFGKYRSWQQVTGRNGPFDDPNICLEQGRIYAEGALVRQAVIQFQRVIELSSDNFEARLWLAQLYVQSGLPDRALELTADVLSHRAVFNLNSANQTDLLIVETAALYTQNKNSEADRIIHTALQENPNNAYLLDSVFHFSLNLRRFTNALVAVNNLLQLNPDDTTLLENKGFIHLQLDQVNEAIPPLTRALTLHTNDYVARFNRAIAYLRVDKLDESQQDYEVLQKAFPKQFQIEYGLGEIAYRRKDTNAAIRNYEAYISDAGTNSAEGLSILARLKELKGTKP